MYSWKPLYAEIANRLVEFEFESVKLVTLMQEMHEAGLKPSRYLDRDKEGAEFPLEELDPFTFLANFNRGLTDPNRIALLAFLKSSWDLEAQLPDDFSGLPVVNNQKSWLMPYKRDREEGHVSTLWKFYTSCLALTDYHDLDTELFDACCKLRGVAPTYLSMGMFWTRPDLWLSVDKKNRAYAETLGVDWRPTTGAEYVRWLEEVRSRTELSTVEFSHTAHLNSMAEEEDDVGADAGADYPPSAQRPMANPFDCLFRDIGQANRVLDTWKPVLDTLKTSEGDPLLCFTVKKTGVASARLRIVYGTWVAFSFESEKDSAEYQFVLTAAAAESRRLPILYRYKGAIDGVHYVLTTVNESRYFADQSELWPLIESALRAQKSKFTKWSNTPYNKSHVYGLIDLVMNPDDRADTLSNGLQEADGDVGLDYWLIAPGTDARNWNEWREQGVARIGWDDVGDLSDQLPKDQLTKVIARKYPDGGAVKIASMLWDFAYGVKLGDIVFAKKGVLKVCGWGVVTGEYHYDAEAGKYRHCFDVDWKSALEVALPQGTQLAQQTLTRMTGKEAFLRHMAANYPGLPGFEPIAAQPAPDPVESYQISDATKDLFIPVEKVEQIVSLLRRKKNVVLQGAPGTGKTFVSRRIAYLLLGVKDESRCPLVQFHQSTTYEDFIQGYRPDGHGGFELKNGSFYQFVRRAMANPNQEFVFLIDEINRGNLSKIFGELMMLIESDKRSARFAVPLTYSSHEEDRFYVPPNVHLIGTMNTADRSLSMVDYALRRRFAFVELDPEFESKQFESLLISSGAKQELVSSIKKTMTALNALIEDDAVNLGRGYRIGHSFFVPPQGHVPDQRWLDEIVHFEVMPLLEEYWCDDEAQLAKAKQLALGEA